MEKMLIFNEQATTASIGDTAHDVYMVPASRFLGATNDATGGVTLTISDNKHVSVMKELSQLLYATGPGYTDGAVVAFDAENSISFSSDVTGIAIAVATAD